jgi:hypothetical protein
MITAIFNTPENTVISCQLLVFFILVVVPPGTVALSENTVISDQLSVTSFVILGVVP